MTIKNSLIIGLGKTGLSCARYLHKQNIPFAVMDTRANPPGLMELKKQFPEVPIYLNGLHEEIILQAKEIVVSPGISLHEPAIAKAMTKDISVVGDIELFARSIKAKKNIVTKKHSENNLGYQCIQPTPLLPLGEGWGEGKIVAITGTNGKGTVTTLVGDMARCAGKNVCVGGNIGTPILDLLTERQPDLYVLEISSFQLETTYSLKPFAATILNISADHLDRYDGDMGPYIAAKQRIYANAEIIIWNRNDINTQPKIKNKKIITFGLSEPKENEFGIRQIDQKTYLAFGNENLLSVTELKIKGKHNWANALAALTLGHALQLPLSAMLQALREFKGLKHRCEWVIEKNGVQWFDDSKGTNVGATIAAITGIGSAISGKVVLIAGGLGKGANFSPLKDPVVQYVKTVVLIGTDAQLIADVLHGATIIKHAESLQQAVELAVQSAQSGDAILLSPACASMDMFRDAEQRGELFKQLVLSL
jgi:UDP-N-acetylmuramoylalanine--D-glutamate ligase